MQAVNRKSLLFGFLVWLIPFIVSVAIFPIRTSSRALFESIMPVVITICVVVFAVLYFRGLEGSSLRVADARLLVTKINPFSSHQIRISGSSVSSGGTPGSPTRQTTISGDCCSMALRKPG